MEKPIAKPLSLKHIDLITIYNNLHQVKGLIGYDINLAINRNKKYLKPEVEALQEMEQKTLDIKKGYLDERIKLQEKYATVDGVVKYKDEYDSGKMVKHFDIPEEKLPEFEKEMAALKLKHKEAIDKSDAEHKECLDFLKEKDSDFKITKVKGEFVPKDISTENMNFIFDIIDCEP